MGAQQRQSCVRIRFIAARGVCNFTALRAGIIIGSGSASFEIIRDLVEKLPVMITPKWLNTKCQPIGISDVMAFLSKALFNPKTFNNNFDIGGPDVLTYKEMLLNFGKARNLKRYIYTVPVMTPKLSSYWLYFVTTAGGGRGVYSVLCPEGAGAGGCSVLPKMRNYLRTA